MNHHHALIRSLIAEIRRLRSEVESADERAAHISARSEQARREADEAQQQAEYDAWQRDEARKREIRNLERARACDDDYAVQSSIRRLRNL